MVLRKLAFRPIDVTSASADWENQAVFQRNRLPHRANFNAPIKISLCGDSYPHESSKWNFEYNTSPIDAPPASRTADEWENFPEIVVPGHWQLQGYGSPQYTNFQFPIPVNPPLVPSENPTGSYFKKFTVPSSWIEDGAFLFRLRFEGVDSAFHVFVNGQEVGYSQGSRNPAEFDVTDLIESENTLLVRVYQWSDGSYIEDQDQWWLSGIFRDVNLLAFSKDARIEDVTVRTILDKSYRDATLSTTLKIHMSIDTAVRLKLYDAEGKVVDETTIAIPKGSESVTCDMSIANPEKWTAERPYLYKLKIKLPALQEHCVSVGFRQVEIKNGNLTVNGVPLLLKGVNRHDHHPRRGRAVTPNDIHKDLLLMKQHNINAIRCSHYPSHPALFDIADGLGFWIIDEADLECHGFAMCGDGAEKWTSDNPDWEAAYLDRMSALVHRDKNHPCVIMWSLGNESFYGRNHMAMYKFAKELDPTRPVHYEGSDDVSDVVSQMYWDLDGVEWKAKEDGDNFKKPFILCEYAHAMGNGPGALEDYQKLFRKYRRLQGGFIWEWANHGLWKKDGNGEGKGYYAYGGDFGDDPNDGTFVMDGLCFSDHRPTPGLVELKKVFEPVTAKLRGDKLEITNGFDFESLDHLEAYWEVWSIPAIALPAEAKIQARGVLPLPHVPAGKTATIAFPATVRDIDLTDETWITISWKPKLILADPTVRVKTLPHSDPAFAIFNSTEKTHATWARADHEVAWSQHRFSPQNQESQTHLRLRSSLSSSPSTSSYKSKLTTLSTPSLITISSPKFTLTFSKSLGRIMSWVHHTASSTSSSTTSTSLITPNSGPVLTVYRAPTDNDNSGDAGDWHVKCVHLMSHNVRSVALSQRSDEVTIAVNSIFAPAVLTWHFLVRTIYTITPTFAVKISTHITPHAVTTGLPSTLPRIGFEMSLPSHMDRVKWCGLGPGESYIDSHTAQRMGIWSKPVAEMQTPYEVPQENGNRTGTRWVARTDSSGRGLLARRVNVDEEASEATQEEPTFDFAALQHSAADLEGAKHPTELSGLDDDSTIWRLDAASHGLGTASCGPGVYEWYRLKPKEMRFGFEIAPVGLDGDVEDEAGKEQVEDPGQNEHQGYDDDEGFNGDEEGNERDGWDLGNELCL